MPIKANDIVAGLSSSVIKSPEWLKRDNYALSKDGVSYCFYGEHSLATPSVYKVIKVKNDVATVQSVFLKDKIDNSTEYFLNWNNDVDAPDYRININVKYLRQLTFFNKECLSKILLEQVYWKHGIENHTKHSLVKQIINEYNVIYKVAKENVKKYIIAKKKYQEDWDSGKIFSEQKEKVIKIIQDMEFTPDNHNNLEMLCFGYEYSKKMKEKYLIKE